VPSGEIAAELGVLVLPSVSIKAPIRASFPEDEVVWACPSGAVPKTDRAVMAEKRREREHMRTSTKVMRKA
jgi:hypothetical protein